jgi:HlyD family secretion protein
MVVNKKRWLILAGAVAAICLILLAVNIWQRIAARRELLAELAEETAVAEYGTLFVTVSASGSIVPQTEIGLAFSTGGQVDEVLVEEGDQVQAGDPLVRLDAAELDLQVTQAEIALRQAEIQLEELLEGAEPDQITRARDARDQAAVALELAQTSYAAAQDSTAVNEMLERAQQDYDDAQGKYNYWWSKWNDGEADHWYVRDAQDKLEDAELALRRAQQAADQQLQSASLELERAEANYRQAQSELETLLAGADDKDVERAQLQVDQAQASLDQAHLRLKRATLTAPLDGTVTAVNVQVAEMAPAGQPAVVLSDLNALAVDIVLDEEDVALVSVGQEARVTLDAVPGVELGGQVVYIAPVADTRSGVVLYPVTVRLQSSEAVSQNEEQATVRSGMTADIEIIVTVQDDALIIPLRAVRSDDGTEYVLRQSDGRGVSGFEEADVELGLMNDTQVEITDGLSEGDVVSVVALPDQGRDGFFGMGFRNMFSDD